MFKVGDAVVRKDNVDRRGRVERKVLAMERYYVAWSNGARSWEDGADLLLVQDPDNWRRQDSDGL